jgi:TPR repeat protein
MPISTPTRPYIRPFLHKTAVKWYRLAAEQGYADAQTNLGMMYGLGKGVIKDWLYAHMWVNLGASNGHEIGGILRDIAAKRITPADLSTAQKLARECVRKKYKGC